MYRHGGAVPMSSQNNQNVNMHHNKNEEINERLKRIISQQVMGRGGGRTMNPLMARALAGQMAKMKKGGKVNKPKMTNKLKAELMMEGLKKYKGKKRKGAKK